MATLTTQYSYASFTTITHQSSINNQSFWVSAVSCDYVRTWVCERVRQSLRGAWVSEAVSSFLQGIFMLVMRIHGHPRCKKMWCLAKVTEQMGANGMARERGCEPRTWQALEAALTSRSIQLTTLVCRAVVCPKVFVDSCRLLYDLDECRMLFFVVRCLYLRRTARERLWWVITARNLNRMCCVLYLSSLCKMM